ncbi:hypothetical protein J1N35_025583, partial [Gossypium stocksii]
KVRSNDVFDPDIISFVQFLNEISRNSFELINSYVVTNRFHTCVGDKSRWHHPKEGGLSGATLPTT